MTIVKEIIWDRITHDYRATLDGILIGFFAERIDAQVALDQAEWEAILAGDYHSAAELDGGLEAA